MKYVIKVSALFLVGLLMAVIIYPIMHELGHSLTAVLVGAKVIEINLLPLPNVLCDISNTDNTGIVFIGFSGMVIPFLFSAVIKPKGFWLWYSNFVLRGISALSFVVAIISTLSFIAGSPMPNDDITQILLLWQNGQWLCLVTSVFFATMAVWKLVKEKPFNRCFEYFNRPTKRTASAA